ncbi:MAG TPA: aquaporin [Actinomycetota bacterium]|nr:aquaporin [Actinomycetota bacterium]
MESLGKAAVAEFVATFALIFVGAGAVIVASSGQLDLVGVALAHGLVLAVMVSVTGHVSGGLVNPAVTIALWAAGKIGTQRGAVLIVAQLVGAVMGALLLRYVVGGTAFDGGGAGAPALAPGLAVGKGIVLEAILTFFLVFVVFGTAVDDKGPWNKTAGFTIGLVIAFDILAFGPLTGAAMNPARWFGPALVGGIWDDALVWIVGPIAGAIIAGVLYTAVLLRGREPATP